MSRKVLGKESVSTEVWSELNSYTPENITDVGL